MGYSYKVIYNKDNRKNKSGIHSISIRVTVDRSSKYLPLKEQIEEKYWNDKENRWIKDNHPAAFELNSLIRKKIDLLHKYEYRQKLFGKGTHLDGYLRIF